MKIQGIGPTAGAPAIDNLDRHLEASLAGLAEPEAEPLTELEPSADSSDQEQTRDGVLRLVEYIHRRQEQRRRARTTPVTKQDRALAAYARTVDGDLDLRGHNVDRYQ